MVLECAVVLVLAVGAVARVTRFLNSDVLAEGIRQRVDRWFPGEHVPNAGGGHPIHVPSWQSEFVQCPWCVSVWVSAPVTAAAWFASPALQAVAAWWFVGPALWLTISYVVALTAARLDN